MEGTPEVGSHAIEERLGDVEDRLTAVEESGGGGGAAEDWHEIGAPGEPAFENGAAARVGFQTPAFRLNGDRVEFRGVIDGDGIVAFTLPEGYRPPVKTACPIASILSDYGTLVIDVDGSVEITSSSSGNAIEGVSFAIV